MSRDNLMRFVVPISLESLGSFNISGRAVIPFYINPQNFQIQDKKLIQKTLTKGGFSIQYWGEDLSSINVSGMTGSGGIEAAYLLRDVYRYEQIKMKEIILKRMIDAEQEASSALESGDIPPESFYSFVDELTGGAISQITNGVQSIIDTIGNSYFPESIEKVILNPTAGAFATSIDIYFGGERYRGYFENFSISENAQSPGIVEYQFTFIITKRWGNRKNYMPWHRNPVDLAGKAVPASLPLQGAATEELTFPTGGFTQESLTNPNLRNRRNSLNQFISDDLIPEPNSVPLNRFESNK